MQALAHKLHGKGATQAASPIAPGSPKAQSKVQFLHFGAVSFALWNLHPCRKTLSELIVFADQIILKEAGLR